MTSNKIYIPLAFVMAFLFTACEQEFIPDEGEFVSKIVVEGFIEDGDNALPPYVLLTRTAPFFGEFTNDILSDLIVRDAKVMVTKEGGEEVQLTELCLQDLPQDIQREVANLLGINLGSGPGPVPDICAYVDINLEIDIEQGASYDLLIEAGDEVLTANTTIPLLAPLDSIWFTSPPGEPNDTLAEMNVRITDPAGPNFYRYMTAENGEGLTPPFGSVTDDAVFDGMSFSFPLAKADDPADEDVDFENFGLWRVGEMATLKWICLDEDHFNFWQTFEFNRNNQGPFSTYTRVQHNIEGGLGIWGGLSSQTLQERVIVR